IIQMIYDPLYIPTVTSTLMCSIYFFHNILMTIIRRVTIGKTVWHDEINHIRGIKTLSQGGLRSSLFKFIGFRKLAFSIFFKYNFKLLRLLFFSIQGYK